jgi:Cof subfamily protein (haloacid dehalogenase superfamily)
MRYRLLALDVDGTLLDPAGQLRPTVQHAVMAVQERGVRVVLCTGRRFRTALPLAQQLQLCGPAVVHNGALLKDVQSGTTLHQCYMPVDVYTQAFTLLRQCGMPMVYIDAFHEAVDILTEGLDRLHPFQRLYLQDHLTHCRIVPDMATPPAYGVVMMSVMADETYLRGLRPQIQQALEGRARVNMLINKNYQGYILEILHPSASKWDALQRWAHLEGIATEDIIAVGDDENDLELIRHAGLGIAMGNATETVKAAADFITGTNAEDGLVHALQRFILTR